MDIGGAHPYSPSPLFSTSLSKQTSCEQKAKEEAFSQILRLRVSGRRHRERRIRKSISSSREMNFREETHIATAPKLLRRRDSGSLLKLSRKRFGGGRERKRGRGQGRLCP